MALGGILGNGMKIGYSAASPVSWNAIGQLLDIPDLPGITADKIDSTIHSTGGWKRSFPGLKSVNDVTMTLLSDHDSATSPSHAAMWTLNAAGTTVWWRIEVPSDRAMTEYAAWEFQGNISAVSAKTPIDDRQTTEVTIQFDGTSLTRYDPGASAL